MNTFLRSRDFRALFQLISRRLFSRCSSLPRPRLRPEVRRPGAASAEAAPAEGSPRATSDESLLLAVPVLMLLPRPRPRADTPSDCCKWLPPPLVEFECDDEPARVCPRLPLEPPERVESARADSSAGAEGGRGGGEESNKRDSESIECVRAAVV